MLVIRKRQGERIRINDNIEILVGKIGRGQVTLAVKAPAGVTISRGDAADNREARADFHQYTKNKLSRTKAE